MGRRLARHLPVFLAAFGVGLLSLAMSGRSPAIAAGYVNSQIQTDGEVRSMAISGNTLYFGGNFTLAGPYTGGGVPLDPVTAEAVSPFPKVHGTVLAVLPDNQGGWFIGGAFDSVGGVFRYNAARIRANGSVSPWDPAAYCGAVRSLAVSGGTVFLGGDFTCIGEQPRNYLAAVDSSSGSLTDWLATTDGPVNALAVSGGTLIVGGDFHAAGYAGSPPYYYDGCSSYRRGLAAIDIAAPGCPTTWDPEPDSVVHTLALAGGTVYAGGEFSTVGGQSRNYLAEVDLATGQPTGWSPNVGGLPGVDGSVYALAVAPGVVYAGGSFFSVGGVYRERIAAVDRVTASPTSWNPGADGTVRTLAIGDGRLYAGGEFTIIGTRWRKHLAAIDPNTGLADYGWMPCPNAIVFALAAGNTIYAGGRFTSAPCQTRSGLAAMDLLTNTLTAWAPLASGGVHSLAVYDGTVFANAPMPQGIDAFDTSTGNHTGWVTRIHCNDWFNFGIWFAGDGRTLYAYGYFDSLGGAYRLPFGAVDAVTGLATAWAPSPPLDLWGINAMAAAGGRVYMAGYCGVPSDGYFGATDAATGQDLGWNVNPDGYVDAIAATPSTVYVGGYFSWFGDSTRFRLAAIDAATGELTSWNPVAYWSDGGGVYALALGGTLLHVGGGFHNHQGYSRDGLAALDVNTGALDPWDPRLPGEVHALLVKGATVYAGGFEHYDAAPWPPWYRSIGYVAAIPASPSIVGVPRAEAQRSTLALESPRPNPMHRTASLGFDLPSETETRLEVYDVSGRRVVVLIDGDVLPAGHHIARLDPGREGIPAGLYFARLSAAGRSASRRFVIIP